VLNKKGKSVTNLAAYNEANAEVIGISVDSLFVLDKFKKEQSINFPQLSDFKKQLPMILVFCMKHFRLLKCRA